MAEKKNITSPSMGSNDVGTESTEKRGTGVSAGTDTQLHLAAKGKKKPQKNEDILDDEKVVDNTKGDFDFETTDNTDE